MIQVFDLAGSATCPWGNRCEDTRCPRVWPPRRPEAEVEDTAAQPAPMPEPVELHDGVVIIAAPKRCEPGAAERLAEDFGRAWAAGARAVVLSVNCWGGSLPEAGRMADVVGSQPRPVVAFVENALSGGLMVAASCAAVVAAENAALGAVGVITRLCDRSRVLTAALPHHKVDGNERRAPDIWEALPDEEAVLRDLGRHLDSLVGRLARARCLSLEAAWMLTESHNAVFPANRAQQLGLVDGVGPISHAEALARRLGTFGSRREAADTGQGEHVPGLAATVEGHGPTHPGG